MSLKYDDVHTFQPGIYLHYKNHLYEADHLTHNASSGDRIEVHYVGLQLEDARDGPRHATREFSEFLFDQVHPDGSTCKHGSQTNNPRLCLSDTAVTQRFRYLGPMFKSSMLHIDPWNQENHS